jgi:two-component sensor histidine kinase
MASTSPQPSKAGEAAGRRGLIRRFDWASTPLGPVELWTGALRHALELCERSAVPTAVYWGEDLRLFYNEAWAPVLRDRHPSALGRPAAEVWSDLWSRVRPQFDRVIAGGEGIAVYEQMLPLRRDDGVVERTYWNYSLTPLVGDDGRIAGILNQSIEITKALRAERRLSFQIEVADRLRGLDDPEEVKQAAAQLLGEYLGAARVGFAEVVAESEGIVRVRADWTRDGGVASLAGTDGAIAGWGEEALAFLRHGEVLALPDIRALPQAGRATADAWEALGVRALITVPLVRDGTLKALLYVHDPRARQWKRSEAAMARDVAERTWAAVEQTQAEQRQRLLMNELNHRVKNSLATVQAIARQTLKGNISLAEGRARFERRLMALSHAHDLLTEQSWGRAALDRVVRDSIEHLAGDPGRFRIDGESLWLTPRAALALALALHELGTNAAKYGALSGTEGRVEIGWRLDEGLLRLEWKEQGGPPVEAPGRRGFGSRLIERSLGADLRGTATLLFEPDGLRCRIEAPLDAVSAQPI